MKLQLASAFALLMLATLPAGAQGGNVGGADSRGEPLNAPYRAAGVDRETGHTPGYTGGHKRHYKAKKAKKSKKSKSSTTGSHY